MRELSFCCVPAAKYFMGSLYAVPGRVRVRAWASSGVLQ